jgi:2'-deoxynucleoside 5'-phosphate N-hydrolase
LANIYFSGSITGGREDVALYRRMIDALEAHGHRVLAGAVAAEHITDGGESLALAEIFARDIRWLDESDVVVAEVSTPSHGVGYEIAYARYVRRIPVIALYRRGRTKRCSAMISGDPGIRMLEYEDVDAVLESLRQAVRYPDRLP